MSNSSLITYSHTTSKHNNRVKDGKSVKIDKITIHHMAGKMTAKACCDYFCSTDRQVSANYCIGYNGDIGLNVDEKYRAWTSSNRDNDLRAITIEVSNDGGEPQWHVSDASISALIKLCIDICKRNGIKALNYTGNTSGNVTLHEMFANTNCPGPYLKSKIPYIVSEVNSALKSPETTQNGAKISDEKSIDELAKEVIAGKYGNGEARKKALGDKYAAVQKRVNELTASPDITKPKQPAKGDKLVLTNKALYSSSTATRVYKRINGTYYLYDGQKVNGRYRITNKMSRVGKTPMLLYVTGWIEL